MDDIIKQIEDNYEPLLIDAALAREQAVLNENNLMAQKGNEIDEVKTYYKALGDIEQIQAIVDNPPPLVMQANKVNIKK